MPLLVGDRALGIIALHDKEGPDPRFTDDDVRLVETFGQRVATAAELSQRVARESLRRVMDAQELERRRIARELHDETGQALTSILLGLKTIRAAGPNEAAETEEEVRGLVVQALQEVRRLAVELRPKALDDFGLLPALERLAETYGERAGLEIHLQANLPAARLPGELETVLYRLVQEALTNVLKHAEAQTVSILLALQDGSVTAVIEDDGRGFTPGETRADALGLLGMRERLSFLGGALTVESAPGSGTTVRALLPLPNR
jgi:signal transduction histidine kinase